MVDSTNVTHKKRHIKEVGPLLVAKYPSWDAVKISLQDSYQQHDGAILWCDQTIQDGQ